MKSEEITEDISGTKNDFLKESLTDYLEYLENSLQVFIGNYFEKLHENAKTYVLDFFFTGIAERIFGEIPQKHP